MNLFRNNKIIDYDPGPSTLINEASPAQQRCYLNIETKIEKGLYVDVGSNDGYLYAYLHDLNSRVLNAGDSAGLIGLHKKYINFINLYLESKPKITSYFYPYMIAIAILMKHDTRDAITQYINCIIKNNISNASFIASLFVTTNDLTPNNHVPEEYFRAFVGINLRQFLTSTGREHYNQIMDEVFSLLYTDFKYSKTNYLFKLFSFVDGIVPIDTPFGLTSVPISSKGYAYATNAKVKLQVRSAVYNEAKKQSYIGQIMYEAENIFREKNGLQKIGMGWISETLLFRRIEAAFIDCEIKQHASPSFLGKQHYDVYLPEHKIALEYQGDQHFRPNDFFGGEEAYKKTIERDQKKKLLSQKNGVEQIDVLPDYNLKKLITELSILIFGKDNKDIEILSQEAYSRAKDISAKLKPEAVDINIYTKASSKVAKVSEDAEFDDRKMDLRIKKLVATRKKSSYAHDDGLDVSRDKFDEMLEKLDEVISVSKTNPERSNELAKELFNSGYRTPAIYNRMAINYDKMGDYKAEADLLIQMKCDFGYNNDDNRLKKVLKKLEDDYR